METGQTEYTVEYQDSCGVVYYRNIKALDFAEAKAIIRQGNPDAVIRAVTLVPSENDKAIKLKSESAPEP